VALLTACQVQNNNQPIDYATDNSGQTATSFDEIYLNTGRDFSIREEEGIEVFEREVITQEQTTRKAVIVSSTALELKENFRNSSPSTGYTLEPLTEIEVFWPTNTANDKIEVLFTNDQSEQIKGWLLYVNENGNKLVNFVEDFVIEDVTLDGAKIIILKEESNTGSEEILIETQTNIIATEEIIEIEITPSDEETIEAEESNIEVEEEEEITSPIDSEVEETDEAEALDDGSSEAQILVEEPRPTLRPLARPDREPEVEATTDDEIIDATESEPTTDNEGEVEEPHMHTDEEVSFEGSTEFAPTISLIPPTRPDNLVTVVTDEEFENIIERLGLTQIQIPFSISTARSRIETITRAERFSGCSFRPNIGNSYSGRDCYRDLILADDFVEFLEEHAHQCSVNAARDAFNKTPVLIQFSSNAGSINRPNSDTLHYRGRALDLFTATLYWSTDQEDKRTVRLHKNHTDGSSQTERQNHEYYWSFVDCWRDKIRTFKPNSCGASRRGGALTYRFNSAHHNHIHLALPLSNSARRNHGLNCI